MKPARKSSNEAASNAAAIAFGGPSGLTLNPATTPLPPEQQGRRRLADSYLIQRNHIVPDPEQPRKDFDEAELQELTESIRNRGIKQPLTVRWSVDDLFPNPKSPRDAKMIEVDGATIAIHCGELNPAKLTMLHFHGNGETIADYVGSDFHAFNDIGVNMVWVEYRGYGRSTGKPQLVAMLGDGERVVQALGLSFDRVIAFGRSMGSLYAIELASRQPTLAGLVIESGIADPAERFLTYADVAATGSSEDVIRAEVATHFDHQKKLAAYQNPVLILHAENDHLITVSHAERNFKWSASANKKLVVFPYGDHNSIMPFNHAEYFGELRTLVQGIQNSHAR